MPSKLKIFYRWFSRYYLEMEITILENALRWCKRINAIERKSIFNKINNIKESE